jgi:hypothetical protein
MISLMTKQNRELDKLAILRTSKQSQELMLIYTPRSLLSPKENSLEYKPEKEMYFLSLRIAYQKHYSK